MPSQDKPSTRRSIIHASNSVTGFFSTLFDFSFTRFITVQMFPILYAVILASAFIAAGYLTVEAFLTSWWRGLFYLLVAAPVGFIAVATVTRALMEFYLVMFTMAENLDDIRQITQRFSGISESVESVKGITRLFQFWGASNGRIDENQQAEDDANARRSRRKKVSDTWPN